MKSVKIGKLTAISGTVTRTTEVRPELLYGSFICLSCNTEVKDVEQQFRFTEPKRCKNPNCDNHTKWELSTEGSVFSDWQKVIIFRSLYVERLGILNLKLSMFDIFTKCLVSGSNILYL